MEGRQWPRGVVHEDELGFAGGVECTADRIGALCSPGDHGGPAVEQRAGLIDPIGGYRDDDPVHHPGGKQAGDGVLEHGSTTEIDEGFGYTGSEPFTAAGSGDEPDRLRHVRVRTRRPEPRRG